MSFVEFLQDDPLLTREQVMQMLIQVADELDMPDRRGAAIVAGITVSQEAGVNDNDPPYAHRFWCPANHADEESFNYPHDSVSDDGLSVGYFQQQKSETGDLWWGPTSSEMDLHSAATTFMTRLKARGYDASNAQTANDSAQGVQQSGNPGAYAQWFDDIVALYDSVIAPPVVSNPPVVAPSNKPAFNETNLIGVNSISNNEESRDGYAPRLFVLHTEEGGMEGVDLADWMAANSVSYHYIVDDDGTVFDCVDTDDGSWSVLDPANEFTINLVFAASYADWTRQQWIDNMGNAIKIAAWLAVQDCLKYGIPIQVLVGNSYSKLPTTNGITDHKGITVGLGIGTHVDVGPGFPWDLFLAYLNSFASGATVPDTSTEEDDMFSDADRALLTSINNALTAPLFSRSLYREPNEGPVGTLADVLLNDDGMDHIELVERSAVLGDEDSLRRVIRAAAGGGADTSDAAVARAKAVLATVPAAVLQAYDSAHSA